MQQHPGLFIAIEGIDGAGKATQCALLRDRLEAAGYQVLLLSFPRYDQPSSYFIRQYLSGAFGQKDQIGPYTASLFYALDRYEAADAIRKALASGTIVIADRFAGSSMAHQGAKITHPEERRGYFIWLDNLEYYLLNTPRPDLSLVLRVPAETAAEHITDRRERVTADRKLDKQEGQMGHLQAAATVYDDLCQLFPKDFARIDCQRSGQLLEPGIIHGLLWGKLEPLLPAPTMKPATQPAKADTEQDEPHSIQAEECSSNPIETSSLLAAMLAAQSAGLPLPVGDMSANIAAAGSDQPFSVPEGLDDKTQQHYIATMSRLFANYTSASQQLDSYLQKQSGASTGDSAPSTSMLLPLAMRVPAAPAQVQMTTEMPATALSPIIEQLARDVPVGPSNTSEQVKLVNVTPRNELDLVASILFEASDVPLATLTNTVASWNYDQKASVLRAYVALDDNAKFGLHNVRYNWDCFTDIATMCAVMRVLPGNTITWQRLSPRFGYDIPEIIEEAGLADLYEESFDMGLELFSQLQEAGYTHEAAQAVLLGHRVRWSIACSLHDLTTLLACTDATIPTWFTTTIRECVAQTHPILGNKLPGHDEPEDQTVTAASPDAEAVPAN